MSNIMSLSHPQLVTIATEMVIKEIRRREEEAKKYVWQNYARPNQIPPDGDWRVWLILAGRGFGKTRTGAETIRQWVHEKRYQRIALIADTEHDGREIMVEGPSGLLGVHPPDERPLYEPSRRRITWKNGAVATLYSAERYDQLRGAQFDCVWIDELSKFRNAAETWDQMNFGLREGENPRVIVTTTPRPLRLIHTLLEAENSWVAVTRGTTFDNSANLSASFIEHMKNCYEGSRLGDQELYGRVLSNIDGALWNYEMLQSQRIKETPDLKRIIVAVDPATTSSQESNETGIVVAGICERGHGYILEDLSGKYSPSAWANKAIEAYHNYKADRIVAEANQGGDMVESVLRAVDPRVSFKSVHATRGKMVRAEPVLALYEQGKVFHLQPGLELLEEQMCTYVPLAGHQSPDRLDALVWAITELMLSGQPQAPPRVWRLC